RAEGRYGHLVLDVEDAPVRGAADWSRRSSRNARADIQSGRRLRGACSAPRRAGYFTTLSATVEWPVLMQLEKMPGRAGISSAGIAVPPGLHIRHSAVRR